MLAVTVFVKRVPMVNHSGAGSVAGNIQRPLGSFPAAVIQDALLALRTAELSAKDLRLVPQQQVESTKDPGKHKFRVSAIWVPVPQHWEL